MKDPGGEREIEPRTDVEGTARIQQPAQAEPDRARRRERREMTRHDHAGVAERAAVAAGAVRSIDRDPVAALAQ